MGSPSLWVGRLTCISSLRLAFPELSASDDSSLSDGLLLEEGERGRSAQLGLGSCSRVHRWGPPVWGGALSQRVLGCPSYSRPRTCSMSTRMCRPFSVLDTHCDRERRGDF